MPQFQRRKCKLFDCFDQFKSISTIKFALVFFFSCQLNVFHRENIDLGTQHFIAVDFLNVHCANRDIFHGAHNQWKLICLDQHLFSSHFRCFVYCQWYRFWLHNIKTVYLLYGWAQIIQNVCVIHKPSLLIVVMEYDSNNGCDCVCITVTFTLWRVFTVGMH